MTPADDLRALIERHNLTQQQVCDLLTQQGQRTALRTVKSWLSNSPSARACPGWAPVLLRLSLEG